MEVRQVVVSVADVLRAPYSGAERLTQVLLGENVKIEESYGQWFFVRAADGYHGWLTANSMGLYFTPGLAELALFIRPRVIVQPVEGQLNEPCIVYCGTCLAVCGVMPPFIKVILPSGAMDGYWNPVSSVIPKLTAYLVPIGINCLNWGKGFLALHICGAGLLQQASIVLAWLLCSTGLVVCKYHGMPMSSFCEGRQCLPRTRGI